MQDPNTGDIHALTPTPAKLIREDGGKAATLVFNTGEEVNLKGGRFRIVSIGKRFMRLEGLPGTQLDGSDAD